MSKRALTWMQQQFLNVLKDGKWHESRGVITGSGIRGLISRGLIERKHNPKEHPLTWISAGKFRLLKGKSK